jgi:Raf kinase inhibitor-like YbhB/YbcL family protein
MTQRSNPEPRSPARRSTRRALLLAAISLPALACARPSPAAAEGQPWSHEMKLESPAFKHGESIPPKYTCEGEDISPELRWSNLPERTRSLVLIVDDPDAPDPRAPKRTWVHWVLYELPPEAGGLPEGGSPLPIGTLEGLNDWGRTGYGGPCPPIGEHRYFHKLYALDVTLGDLAEPTKAELVAAMQGHILAKAELIGTYEKQHD